MNGNDITKENKGDPGLNIQDIVRLFVRNWYWFAVSVVTALVIASLYLMSAPKVYERVASVLIKDDKTGKSSETALFQDLPVFEGQSNVNNEMIVFHSYGLMEEAVRRLKLDVSYNVRERLRRTELYTRSPIAITFIDVSESQQISFNACLIEDGKITYSDFNIEDMESITVGIGDTVVTHAGKIVSTSTLWNDGSWTGKPIMVKKSDFEWIVNYYCSHLKVFLADKQASVVKLALRDGSPQRAEDLLNTVIAIYNEWAINDKNTMAVNTENFINDRLIIIEQELGNVDQRIQTYKTAHQLTDIESDAKLAIQESSQSDQEVLNLHNRRSMAEYVRNYLANPANSAKLIPANTGIEDKGVESQIDNFNQTMLKRDRLVESSSERNPVVVNLNNDIESMRQNIMRTVDNLIVNLDIQIGNVNARTERTRARISAVPKQQKEVTSIERQQQIKESLYLYLLNKREENALNKAITESTARIIDRARGFSKPVAPDKKIILLAAMVFGLAIPASVLYYILMTDLTVRGRKDVTSYLTVPFIGEIPLKRTGKDKTSGIVVKEKSRDPVSEAFNILRTNIEFLRVKEDKLKVITVTSANPDSGKTFISVNLAASIALTGQRVLLIDMDIRKGTISKTLAAVAFKATSSGLTGYLSRKVRDMHELITVDAKYPGIDLILAGPEAPNPTVLLRSPRLDELIDRMREIYDYIIIDNVPVGMVADAVITNRLADVSIFVIRAGKLDRRVLPDIEQLYRDEKLRNMAVVLNGTGSNLGYGYGYGYGSVE